VSNDQRLHDRIVDLNGEIAQLRADLATVTAHRDAYKQAAQINADAREYERAAHAETRKALELERAAHWLSVGTAARALESTRAELAKSEARVAELLRQKEASWKGYGSNV
jgi:hypothetical protein